MIKRREEEKVGRVLNGCGVIDIYSTKVCETWRVKFNHSLKYVGEKICRIKYYTLL